MSASPVSSLVVVVQEQPSLVEIMGERTLVVDGSAPAQLVELIALPVETLTVVLSETVTLLQEQAQGPAGVVGNVDLGEFF